MIYSFISDIECNPLFTDLPTDYIEKCFSKESTVVKDIPADTLAYSSQSSSLQVAIILKGAARVYSDSQEERSLIRTLNKGDVFGIANLYGEGEPFPTQIVTATNSTILFIDEDHFKDFLEGHPTATRNYIRFLSTRIVFLNKKIATLSAGNAERRLAAHIYEHQVDGIFKASSLSELANILGIGRASLYRGVDVLIDNGLVEKQGKTFTIKNEDELKKFINKQ